MKRKSQSPRPAPATLDSLSVGHGKRVRLWRLLYGNGPGNGTLLVLPLDVRVEGGGSGPETGPQAPLPLAEALATYERNLIRQALREAGGVQRQAAARLGLRPTTLHEKMKRLGVREGGGLAGRAQQGPPSLLVSKTASPDNDPGKEVGRADVAADPTADVA